MQCITFCRVNDLTKQGRTTRSEEMRELTEHTAPQFTISEPLWEVTDLTLTRLEAVDTDPQELIPLDTVLVDPSTLIRVAKRNRIMKMIN